MKQMDVMIMRIGRLQGWKSALHDTRKPIFEVSLTFCLRRRDCTQRSNWYLKAASMHACISSRHRNHNRILNEMLHTYPSWRDRMSLSLSSIECSIACKRNHSIKQDIWITCILSRNNCPLSLFRKSQAFWSESVTLMHERIEIGFDQITSKRLVGNSIANAKSIFVPWLAVQNRIIKNWELYQRYQSLC